jgi:hypothetical protein
MLLLACSSWHAPLGMCTSRSCSRPPPGERYPGGRGHSRERHCPCRFVHLTRTVYAPLARKARPKAGRKPICNSSVRVREGRRAVGCNRFLEALRAPPALKSETSHTDSPKSIRKTALAGIHPSERVVDDLPSGEVLDGIERGEQGGPVCVGAVWPRLAAACWW